MNERYSNVDNPSPRKLFNWCTVAGFDRVLFVKNIEVEKNVRSDGSRDN